MPLKQHTIIFLIKQYIVSLFHGYDLDIRLVLLVFQSDQKIRCQLFASDMPYTFICFEWISGIGFRLPSRKVRQLTITAVTLQIWYVRVFQQQYFISDTPNSRSYSLLQAAAHTNAIELVLEQPPNIPYTNVSDVLLSLSHPESPSHSEEKRGEEHHQDVIAQSNSLYPSVEFLLQAFLQYNAFIPLLTVGAFMDCVKPFVAAAKKSKMATKELEDDTNKKIPLLSRLRCPMW